MNTKTPPKHREIRQQLEAAIRSGEFAIGEKIPAEQDLATRFGVSAMTARQAVTELVAADVLERRSRRGTFVRQLTSEKLNKVTLNLITVAYEGWGARTLLSRGVQRAQELGWNANVIRLAQGQQDPAVRVIQNGELAITLLDHIAYNSSLGRAMRFAGGRVVSLHYNLSAHGVPSIFSGINAELTLAMNRLHADGHRRIAIVSQFPPAEPEGGDKVDWGDEILNAVKTMGLQLDVVPVRTPLFYSPTPQTYDAVQEYLKQNSQTTALIVTGDEIALGALAACRDIGRSIPESLSLLCFGNATNLDYFYPPVTCIDTHFDLQFDIAIDILKTTLAGGDPGSPAHVTPIKIVERRSIGPAPANVKTAGRSA